MYKIRISQCKLFAVVTVFCLVFVLSSGNQENDLPIIPTESTENYQTDISLNTKVPQDTLFTSEDQSTEPHSLDTSILTHHFSHEESPPNTLTFTQSLSFMNDVDLSTIDSNFQSDSWLSQIPQRIKVQKCCKTNQVLQLDQYKSECVDREANFVIDVFFANATHYWNYTTSSGEDVVVEARIPCTESKYILDPTEDVNDTFYLLHNSSLYVPNPHQIDMFGLDDYCVDIIQSQDILLTAAVICTPTPKTQMFHYFFGTGLIISVISLICLAVYSNWRTDIDSDHKKCFVFFAGSMATSYFFLTISTFFATHFHKNINIIIAHMVYYLKLNYFIWLTILCYDTRRCVKLETDDPINRKSFIQRYLQIAFVTPLLLIGISLFDHWNPALPNLYLEFSYSSSRTWPLVLFYIPTLITLVVDLYFVISIVLPPRKFNNVSQLINHFKQEKVPLYPENFIQLKNMYRRTWLLCIIMLISLLIDFIIFVIPSYGEQKFQFFLRNVLYCLLGLFVSSIFIRCKCFQKEYEEPHEITELENLTNGNLKNDSV